MRCWLHLADHEDRGRVATSHAAPPPLTLALLAVIAALSLWTPLAQPQIAQRWFSLPNMFWFPPVPLRWRRPAST